MDSPCTPPSLSEFRFEFEFEFESESEFEFWNSGLQPHKTPLHSADQLFSHGFLLPLHSLPAANHPASTEPDSTEPSALITSSAKPILSASKRWREIFKKKIIISNNNEDSNKSEEAATHDKVDKKREKDRKNRHGPASAELNINIWPFSRSRSAGSNATRSSKPALSSTTRKASSAPCSRSNSSGDSKSSSSRRSWPGSPARPGVYVGRASPVWQASRKTGPGGRAPARGKALNMNVPVCVGGHQQRLSCRSDGGGAVACGGVKSVGGGSGGGNGNLFGLRGLFIKKSNTSAVLTA